MTADGGLLYNGEPNVYLRRADNADTAPTPLLLGPGATRNASVSPNGSYIAYQSNESGRDEVYVRPFPDVGAGRWQISSDGGTRPIWNTDGNELFYYVPRDVGAYGEANSGTLMSVSIEYAPVFRAARPRLLFEGTYQAPNRFLHTYDVSPDGQRFLMFKKSSEAAEQEPLQWVIVQNWLARVRLATAAAE